MADARAIVARETGDPGAGPEPFPKARDADSAATPSKPVATVHETRVRMRTVAPSSEEVASNPDAVPAPMQSARSEHAAPARAVIAPLSEAAAAGRSRTEEARAPIVHVTIDRIDVRVPAAAPPASHERRARTQPSVSLADYLGGNPRGGRT
jgi:hypothetical protein